MKTLLILMMLMTACTAQTGKAKKGQVVTDDSTGSYFWYDLKPDTVIYIANFVRGGWTTSLTPEQYCKWLDDSDAALVDERRLMLEELKFAREQVRAVEKNLKLLDKQAQFLRQTKKIIRDEIGIKCTRRTK